MENLKETRQRLKHLSAQIDERNMLLHNIHMSEDEYIEENSEVPKPQKRSVNNVLNVEEAVEKVLRERNVGNIKANTMIKAIASLPILVGCVVAMIMNILIKNIMSILLLLPFALIGIWFLTDAIKGKKQLDHIKATVTKFREEAKEKDEKNQLFNDTEYPELLKAYEQEVQRLKPVYAEMKKSAPQRINELEVEMEQDGPVLAKKYHGDIKEIIGIIDDGRATSLPEAINVLIADKNAQKILEEQKLQSELQRQAAEEAEAQRREMERHNRQMETAANEQLQAQKNQIDYAKCHNCSKESYCYKKSCTGYRPK